MKPYVVRSLALLVTLFFFACEGEVVACPRSQYQGL